MRTPRRVEALAGALVLGGLVLAPTVAAVAALPSDTSTTVTSTTSSTTVAPPTSMTVAPTTSTTLAPAVGGNAGNAVNGSAEPSSPACTPATFADAQQHVEAQLSSRAKRLDGLMAQVQVATDLTSSDQSALEHDISAVWLPGIQALQSEVQQATTCSQVRQVAHYMVYNYRVYLVITPETHETIVADRESAIAQTLVSLEPTMQSAMTWGQEHGEDVTNAQVLYNSMKSQLSSANTVLSGVSATLLTQTPADYPGNASVFRTAHDDETTARDQLRTAFDQVTEMAGDLGAGRVGSLGLKPAAG